MEDDRNHYLVPDYDEQPEIDGELCETHQQEDIDISRKLTRQERLQGLADSGCDTWEDYRGER